MAAPRRFDDTVLLLGDQQIAVEVDVGLFLPDGGLWGGVLRHVPERLANAVRDADDVRLRLPTGQERRIRPLVTTNVETCVPFVGEGTMPS